MIKNIMKNIGTRSAKMGSKEYNEQYGLSKEDVSAGAQVDKIYERQLKRIKELRAKGLTDEQIDNDNIIKQTKEDMKNIGAKPAEVKEKVKLFDEYKLPTKEAILKRNEFLKGKNVNPKTLKNEEFNTLAKELDDALGIGDISLSQELLVSDEEEK